MKTNNSPKFPGLTLFFQHWDKFKKYAIAAPIFKILEVIFDLMIPLIVAKMVDEGVGAQDISVVKHYGYVLIVMAIFGYICTVVCQKFAALTSQGVGGELRDALFNKTLELGLPGKDRFGNASLVTRLTSDVLQIQVAISLGVRQLIRWPFLGLGSMIAAILIDPKLGLIFLITTPLVALGFWWVIARCIPYFQATQKSLDAMSCTTEETLGGMRVIRAFMEQGRVSRKFQKEADEYRDLIQVSGKISAALNPVTLLILDLGICAILVSGANQVYIGRLERGQVLAFINYMAQTLMAVGYVANMVVVFTRASASASRINQVLQSSPSVSYGEMDPRAPDANKSCPCFELDQVSFTYESASGPSLSDISFSTGSCRRIGIIGPTGSGKSTLVYLLAHLYDVSQGRLYLYGHDIGEYSKEFINKEISYVAQKASLIQGSVRDNLCWRDPKATDDELIWAMKVAGVDDFIPATQEGLDTKVATAGANFSGGQRQRLNLARGLVGHPSILILDAVTSALDAVTEKKILDNIASLDDDLTTIVVSERATQVALADHIIVLDEGIVQGAGTHEELMESCMVYHQLYKTQSQEV